MTSIDSKEKAGTGEKHGVFILHVFLSFVLSIKFFELGVCSLRIGRTQRWREERENKTLVNYILINKFKGIFIVLLSLDALGVNVNIHLSDMADHLKEQKNWWTGDWLIIYWKSGSGIMIGNLYDCVFKFAQNKT